MNTAQTIWAALILAQGIVALPFVHHIIWNWKNQMPLDFTKLQAATAEVATNATALQAQAAASDDAANQSAIDSVTASLTTANATLAALLPAPAPAEPATPAA